MWKGVLITYENIINPEISVSMLWSFRSHKWKTYKKRQTNK